MNFRKMFAFRKADGVQFLCGSEDVCRVEEGSTNPFLTEPRVLEKFLSKVEPNYSRACDKLKSKDFSSEDVLVIAGFAAFVIGCSPTAVRLGSTSFERLAHTEVELMEGMGMLEKAPPELGGKSAVELLREGTIKVDTDEKYPQAMGISGIIELTRSFATFHWEILINPQSVKFPFLTSDYPAAIEGLGRQIPAVRIIPLRPDLAVRIVPQIRPPYRPDLSSDFRYKVRRLTPSQVREANVAIVRSAENLVFSSLKAPWVAAIVSKNSMYRVELDHRRIPKGSGYLLLNSTVVRESSACPT